MNPRIAILGAGPAGLSAALWAHNLGLDPLVLERTDSSGGNQNLNFLPNKWLLGHEAQTGPELARRFDRHVRASGIVIRTGTRVERIEHAPERGFILRTVADTGAEILSCAALLIATGTTFRGTEVLAGIPGFVSLPTERMVCGPFAFKSLETLAGRTVLIVGGGDNAMENAKLLLDCGATVLVAARSRVKAQTTFVGPVLAHPRAELLEGSRPVRFDNTDNRLVVHLATPGGERRVAIDHIHVLAGYTPNSAEVAALLHAGTGETLKTDRTGYIEVDHCGRTSVAGVYAAGDVCDAEFPCVISALAAGARASKIIERDLRSIEPADCNR